MFDKSGAWDRLEYDVLMLGSLPEVPDTVFERESYMNASVVARFGNDGADSPAEVEEDEVGVNPFRVDIKTGREIRL